MIVTVRPKYACRACTDGVTQAPAPATLIDGGLPTEGAIAHVLVSKYADHLRYTARAKSSRALASTYPPQHPGRLGGCRRIPALAVVDRLAEHLKASAPSCSWTRPRPAASDPGRGRTKTGYLWALARDDRAKMAPASIRSWCCLTRVEDRCRGLVHEQLRRCLERAKLFMDETTAPVLDPGRGRTKTGYLWAPPQPRSSRASAHKYGLGPASPG